MKVDVFSVDSDRGILMNGVENWIDFASMCCVILEYKARVRVRVGFLSRILEIYSLFAF